MLLKLKRNVAFWCLSFLGLGISGCGKKIHSKVEEAWDFPNDPSIFDPTLEYSLDRLPASGQIAHKAWSDSYWPSYAGGIASRWRKSDEDTFSYLPPTKVQLSEMALAERANLSPAEKYDAFVGRFDYPLVEAERKRTSPNRPSWEGLCHGWAVASLNFPEPKPILLRSAGGIEIPFGSSDIKALLALVQGQYSQGASRVVGQRCNISLENQPEAAHLPQCRDLNAGSFHVMLANYLGLKGKGFVLDITRDFEVWNHPVTAFESRVLEAQPLSPNASPLAVRAYKVETTVKYMSENSPTWEATNGTDMRIEMEKTYHYVVELSTDGKIVGGEWSDDDRPDFLWMRSSPGFGGYFAPLQVILQQSIRGESFPNRGLSDALFQP